MLCNGQVQTLNLILLTSSEAWELRRMLKQHPMGTVVPHEDGSALFVTLYPVSERLARVRTGFRRNAEICLCADLKLSSAGDRRHGLTTPLLFSRSAYWPKRTSTQLSSCSSLASSR